MNYITIDTTTIDTTTPDTPVTRGRGRYHEDDSFQWMDCFDGNRRNERRFPRNAFVDDDTISTDRRCNMESRLRFYSQNARKRENKAPNWAADDVSDIDIVEQPYYEDKPVADLFGENVRALDGEDYLIFANELSQCCYEVQNPFDMPRTPLMELDSTLVFSQDETCDELDFSNNLEIENQSLFSYQQTNAIQTETPFRSLNYEIPFRSEIRDVCVSDHYQTDYTQIKSKLIAEEFIQKENEELDELMTPSTTEFDDSESQPKSTRQVKPQKNVKYKKGIFKPTKEALKPKQEELKTKIQQKIAQNEPPQTKPANFDFFYKRTLFRSMTIWYKTEFKPYFDMFKRQRDTLRPLSHYLVQFTQELLPGLLESMSCDAEICEYLRILEQVVFCHRFNKVDPYLQQPLIDYSLIRDPMYKYSRHAQDNFFKVPVLAFLFGWFCKSEKAYQFMMERCEEHMSVSFSAKIQPEALHMYQEAIIKLGRGHCLEAYLKK